MFIGYILTAFTIIHFIVLVRANTEIAFFHSQLTRTEQWYKGRITKIAKNGLYNVRYDDGENDVGLKRISIRRYIPLTEDEIVQSKIIDKNGNDEWKLSTITKVNDDGTVDVKHFDGETFYSLPAGIFVQRFDWRYQQGNRVLAKWKDHGWFKAKVAKVNSDGTYDVDFDDGDFRKSADKSDIKFAWINAS